MITTPRETHANNLALIAEISASPYYRRMSFQEADAWLTAFEAYQDKGYPKDFATQYAWDHYFAPRIAKRK